MYESVCSFRISSLRSPCDHKRHSCRQGVNPVGIPPTGPKYHIWNNIWPCRESDPGPPGTALVALTTELQGRCLMVLNRPHNLSSTVHHFSVSVHFSFSAHAVTCQRSSLLCLYSCLISYYNSIHVHPFSIYKPAFVVVGPQSEYQLSSPPQFWPSLY